MPDTPKSD